MASFVSLLSGAGIRRGGGVLVPATFLVAALFCLVTTQVHAVLITNYTVTSVTSAELPGLPADHWAQYTSLCSSPSVSQSWNTTSVLSEVFPAASLSQMRAPFFAYNTTPWYVTNMGFLSPTPYGMCSGFCTHDFFAYVGGDYAFSDDSSVFYNGGGDWPMVSLYSTLFSSDRGSARPLVVTLDSSGADSTETGGSFTDGTAGAADTHSAVGHNGTAPPPNAAGRFTTVEYCNVPLQGTAATSPGLTAQLVVYANGTTVMRYRTLPPEDALPQYVRSTGLVYSRRLRTVVPTPTRANGVVAYRFDPVYDTCDAATDAAACAAAASAGAGGSTDCVWCGATSACASRSMVADVCPGGQWAMAAGESGAGAQKFYNISIDYNGSFFERVNPERFEVSIGGFRAFRAQFNSRFPFFNGFYGPPSCFPGFMCCVSSCAICNAVNSSCPNGDYRWGMLALESALTWTPTATVYQRSCRVDGSTMLVCTDWTSFFFNSYLLRGAVPRSSSTDSAVFSIQLHVGTDGTIDMVIKNALVEDGAPFLTFPAARIGLVRHGVSDASSVLVPQSLQRSGVHVRFVPQTACADCGLHGSCDEATGVCGCMAGYYGAQCRACPVCGEGSVCDDGVGGSGACVCAGGGDCGSGCDAAGGDGGGGCVGCSAVGGRCECSRCVCVDGWSGANCSEAPVDGCRAYSFDGCEVCGQHEGCVFCFDSTCYNASLSGTRSGYRCSYSTPAADTRACRTYGSLFKLPSGVPGDNLSTFAWAAGLLIVVFVSCLVCFLVLRCFRSPPNSAVAYASSSIVGLKNSLRHRTVVPFDFTRRRLPGKVLSAVPLKQVSLARLFRRRMEAAEGIDPLPLGRKGPSRREE